MKIPDADAYHLLEKYEIPVAPWCIVRSLEQAIVAAENMHFPLILKVDSPDVMHKMSSGCIRTAYDKDHLRKMYEAVVHAASEQTSRINGVILQEFIRSDLENTHEFIIGAKQDAQFGMIIMFGSGGRMTWQNDICFRLIPINEHDAKQMLSEPKIAKIVTRHEKIADILVKVSRLAEYEHISELDINPLLVSDRGVLAADVRILVDA